MLKVTMVSKVASFQIPHLSSLVECLAVSFFGFRRSTNTVFGGLDSRIMRLQLLAHQASMDSTRVLVQTTIRKSYGVLLCNMQPSVWCICATTDTAIGRSYLVPTQPRDKTAGATFIVFRSRLIFELSLIRQTISILEIVYGKAG